MDHPAEQTFQEPTDKKTRAGYGKFLRPNTPYDNFMESQGIPTYRDIGVRRLQDLIFTRPCHLHNRVDPRDDYFKDKEEVTPVPLRGLPMSQTNIIPAVRSCEWPMDNRRSPGYRRIEPHIAGQQFCTWIGQHETG